CIQLKLMIFLKIIRGFLSTAQARSAVNSKINYQGFEEQWLTLAFLSVLKSTQPVSQLPANSLKVAALTG
ncbi:hypothetical protein, partial [Vibrio metschnikovii]|uniref:hypothetical protein n=1 Tax=Vibrio metschnikovii TaxID=28172 RepID=UPI002FC65D76